MGTKGLCLIRCVQNLHRNKAGTSCQNQGSAEVPFPEGECHRAPKFASLAWQFRATTVDGGDGRGSLSHCAAVLSRDDGLHT